MHTKEAERNGLNHKDTKTKTGPERLQFKKQSQGPKCSTTAACVVGRLNSNDLEKDGHQTKGNSDFATPSTSTAIKVFSQ